MDLYQIIITHNRAWTVREIIFFIFAFATLLAATCCLLYTKKIILSQAASGLAAVIFLAVVFASTVFTRNPSSTMKYELGIFWSWYEVFVNHDNDLLLENLLNCILLLPLGVLLPVIMKRRMRWFLGFFCGFAVSAIIEVCQLLLRRGLFEWDDMIHNGIGCMAGCVIMSLLRHNKK